MIAAELRRIATEPVDADELSRAKENVKGRLALSLESTLTRMNRLGGSVLMDIPLLSLDEMVDRIDAVAGRRRGRARRRAVRPGADVGRRRGR